MSAYVIAYDAGTTAIKTCLFEISEKITLIDSAMEGYELFFLDNGGVEQDPLQWWQAMCHTTAKIMKTAGIPKEEIAGISFCAQMQALLRATARSRLPPMAAP